MGTTSIEEKDGRLYNLLQKNVDEEQEDDPQHWAQHSSTRAGQSMQASPHLARFANQHKLRAATPTFVTTPRPIVPVTSQYQLQVARLMQKRCRTLVILMCETHWFSITRVVTHQPGRISIRLTIIITVIYMRGRKVIVIDLSVGFPGVR